MYQYRKSHCGGKTILRSPQFDSLYRKYYIFVLNQGLVFCEWWHWNPRDAMLPTVTSLAATKAEMLNVSPPSRSEGGNAKRLTSPQRRRLSLWPPTVSGILTPFGFQWSLIYMSRNSVTAVLYEMPWFNVVQRYISCAWVYMEQMTHGIYSIVCFPNMR